MTIPNTSERGKKGSCCHRAHILFGIHGKMNVLESWYYNVNRISFLICGLWPYQNTKFRYVRSVCILGIFVFFVISQVHINLTKRKYFRVIIITYKYFHILLFLVIITVYLRVQFQTSVEDLFGHFSCYFMYSAIHRLFN